MFNFNIHKLFIIMLATLSQSRRLTDYQEGIIIPKIYKIIERNNKIVLQKTESEEFDKKGLKDFLQNNANVEYRVNNILNRQEETNAGVKKRWIKRIVPHTQETSNIAFDKYFGLSFKPLIRLHKTKKIQLDHSKSIPKLNRVQNELNALRTRFTLEKMRQSRVSENTYTNEAAYVIGLMREVDTIIGEIGLPYLSGKLHQTLTEHEKKISPAVEALHRDILSYVDAEQHKLLRKGAPKIEEKDAEENNEKEKNSTIVVVGEGFTIKKQEDFEPDELPCPLFPHQPLWNHWTYSQMLYKDECPDGQIKIGTICSKAPGHRRLD